MAKQLERIALLLVLGALAIPAYSQKIRTVSGDIQLVTEEEDDVRLVRSYESVSLWDMSDKIGELTVNITQAVSSVRSEIQEAMASTTAETSAELSAVSSALTGAMMVQSGLMDTVGVISSTQSQLSSESSSSVSSLQSALAVQEREISSMQSCAAQGRMWNNNSCELSPVISSEDTTFVCNNQTLGQSRWNTNLSQLEFCVPGRNGTQYITEFVALTLCRIGTAASCPAKSGSQIKEQNPGARSGMYWIQPEGEDAPAHTYCDMEYNGGGYCLASSGYLANAYQSSSNRNMINMNRPNGYNWNPEARRNTHMLIPLSQGAVQMARGSTSMIMAAGGNPSSGGINLYTYVYEISMGHVASSLDFQNGNRYHRGCNAMFGNAPMPLVSFRVQGLKGDRGVVMKRSTREAMMISWGDSYPSGYGFSTQRSSCTNSWGDGPFFPSIHSGDGHSCGSYNQWPRINSPPDVDCGRYTYTHRGWYGLNNGNYYRSGQMSIWFK